jgi:WD40-like Beta Propeller Repeat
MEARRTPGRSRSGPTAVLLVALALGGAACAPTTNPPSPTASAAIDATLGPLFPPTATPAGSPSAVPSPTPGASRVPNLRPFAASGLIALGREDGSLALVDARGAATLLADASGGSYGFPAWSPDGRTVASIRATATARSVVVIDVVSAASGSPAQPRVIFENPAVAPFYLSWRPDGTAVSFLSDEGDGISLRIAPSDGSAALDGTSAGAVIGTGSPFYFDWVGPDRLFAHVGTGPDALLGEIDLDGKPVAAPLASPGDFRSADVSADGTYVGYVRAGAAGTDAVVVATRDGKREHSIPVHGLTAIDFSPAANVLASIGEPTTAISTAGVPIGPLRLIDAETGKARTLLEGSVVTFSWSPDGRTIAAIRVIPPGGGTATATTTASPAPSASPGTGPDVHLTFVDVETGRIRSDPPITPAQRYTNQVLTYFDQYALSHRMWSPDSATLLVPQVDASGQTTTDVFYPDGGAPTRLDGDIGFWSP